MKKAVVMFFCLTIMLGLCACTMEDVWRDYWYEESESESTESTYQVEDDTYEHKDEEEVDTRITLSPEIESWIDDTAEERHVLEAVIEFDDNRDFDIVAWASRMEAVRVGYTQSEILEIIATEGCNTNRFNKDGNEFWTTFAQMPYSMRFCDSLSVEILQRFSEKMDSVLEEAEISQEEWLEFKGIVAEYFAQEEAFWKTYHNVTDKAESGYGQRCNEAFRKFLEIKSELEGDDQKTQEEKETEIEVAYEEYRAYKDTETAKYKLKKANALAQVKLSMSETYKKVQEHLVYKKLLLIWNSENWIMLKEIVR